MALLGMQLSLLEKVFVLDLSNTKHKLGLYIHPLAEVTAQDSTNNDGRVGFKE
jgi:hypothetical protein